MIVKHLQSGTRLDHTFSVISSIANHLRYSIMHPKMIILLTCLAMAVSVGQAQVLPCPITSNTTEGLQSATDCTIANCQTGLASTPGGGTSGAGGLLSDLLGGSIGDLLDDILAALGPLLDSVLALVVKLLKLVLALVVQVVNLVIKLLKGLLSSSQYQSAVKNWYSNGCSQVSSYQNTGVSGVLGLVLKLLSALLNNCNGPLLQLYLQVGNILGLNIILG